MRRWIALGAWAVLIGCAADDDLGSPCHLLRSDGTELDPRPGHDTLQSGSGECEQFACVSFGGAAAVCSRPCASAGDECSDGSVCRPVVLDPVALAQLRSSTAGQDLDGDGRDDYEQLVAGLVESLYCGPR